MTAVFAWRCTWGGITAVVAAPTRAVAGRITMASVQEVYPNPSWKTLRVRRAPEHDAWAAKDTTGHAWDEEQIPKPCPPSQPAQPAVPKAAVVKTKSRWKWTMTM